MPSSLPWPWRSEWGLFVALLVAYNLNVHYTPAFAPANESVRLYATQALVDHGQLALDPVLAAHGVRNVDKASYQGRAYLDKAPGASLLAAPVYAVGRLLGGGAHSGVLHYWLELFTRLLVGLPCALAGLVLRRTVVLLGGSFGAGTFAALLVGLASPVAIYATLFFGHGLAAALAMFGYYAAVASPGSSPTSRGPALAAGAFAGLMVLVETQTAALAVGLLAALALRRGARSLLLAGLGALPFAAAQAIWNYAIFGNPFEFAYGHKADATLSAIHATGLFGMGLPSAEALVGLTFGPHRGLFFHAPALLLAVFVVLPGVSGAARWAAGLAVLHTLFLAGFKDWPAGDSWAPRHLLPAVPLLGVAAGLALDRCLGGAGGSEDREAPPLRLGAPTRYTLMALVGAAFGWGITAAWLPVVTFPYAPTAFAVPLLELAVPYALAGYHVPGPGLAVLAVVCGLVALASRLRWSRLALVVALALAVGVVAPLLLSREPDARGQRIRARVACLMEYVDCRR